MDTTQVGQTDTAEVAAFLAIDWADQKHEWKMYVPELGKFESGGLDHRPESVEAFAAALAFRFGGRKIEVALEQSRGALFYMLTKYAYFAIRPVPPSAVANYRKVFAPSGDKSDCRDVDLILDLLLKHRERFPAVKIEDEKTRLLMLLNEQRRNQVNAKTALTNELTANLKLYFPQILEWFDEMDSPLVADLLRRWPTLPKLKQAPAGTLRKFFHQHNCRSEERIEERIAQIGRALPATTGAAIVEAGTMLTPGLLDQIAIVVRMIKKQEERIAQLFDQHPDAFIFASFPAAGPALAPRLLTAMGTDRDRFAAANDVGSYTGIAPVRKQSGKTCVVVFRRACPKFVRQTFHEWARCTVSQCAWAAEHYQRQRDKGNGHHAAIRSLANKWIRIVYRCWTNRAPYDEQRYLAARARRRAPKVKQLVRAM